MLRMLVLMSEILALTAASTPFQILNLHRELHGVGSGSLRLAPLQLDLDAPLRVVEQVDNIRTGRGIDRDTFPRVM